MCMFCILNGGRFRSRPDLSFQQAKQINIEKFMIDPKVCLTCYSSSCFVFLVIIIILSVHE